VRAITPQLFGDASPSADPLIGLEVSLPDACPRCALTIAVIGAGRAMHKASLHCRCGRHRGWVSEEPYQFLRKTIELFGRPTTPIAIRRNRHRNLAGADTVTNKSSAEEGK
jgi:hypothetical protein